MGFTFAMYDHEKEAFCLIERIGSLGCGCTDMDWYRRATKWMDVEAERRGAAPERAAPTTRKDNEMDGLEKERARLVAARDAADRRYEMSIALLSDATQRRREACDEANAAALSVYDFDVEQGAD